VALLKLLHRMTGHAIPLDSELGQVESDSVVRVLGWRESRTRTGQAHLVYTVLASAPARLMREDERSQMPTELSEARLVHRRYRDFAKLHAVLAPRAKAAALALPALPSKLKAFGRNLSPEVGSERQRALHDWLCWVCSQPALLCDELRLFLGLSPLEEMAETPFVSPSQRSSTSEPATPETVSRCASMDEEMLDANEPTVAVNLAELEAKAVEAMLDDSLWGRR